MARALRYPAHLYRHPIKIMSDLSYGARVRSLRRGRKGCSEEAEGGLGRFWTSSCFDDTLKSDPSCNSCKTKENVSQLARQDLYFRCISTYAEVTASYCKSGLAWRALPECGALDCRIPRGIVPAIFNRQSNLQSDTVTFSCSNNIKNGVFHSEVSITSQTSKLP